MPRLEYLDAVRGLAAVSVVLFHYFQAYGPPPAAWFWTKTPMAVVCDGPAAVSLFFVLSGLVLARRHFRSAHSPSLREFDLGGYVIGRVCRIWLPFLAVLVASAFFSRQAFARYDTRPAPSAWLLVWFHNPTWPISPGFLVHDANLFRMNQSALIPQGWTLSVELVLSLLVPVGVLLAARSDGWLVLAATVCTICIGASAFLVHFAIGILIAKHLDLIQANLESRPLARTALLIAGLLVYTARSTLPIDWGWPGKPPIWWATGLGAAMILCAVAGWSAAKRLLGHPLLRHVGRVSYSLYLVHLGVLCCLAPAIVARLPTPGLAWIGGLIATLGASLILANLFYHAAEVPSMALGHRLRQPRDLSRVLIGRIATIAPGLTPAWVYRFASKNDLRP